MHYAGIALGCLIASSSINLFLVPSHLLTGGVTGIAIIFYYLADLPIGVQTLVYNVPLLLAAWRLMGKKYTIDIVIGTVLFSLCLDATRFLNGYLPVEDLMLAAIFGGVFNGIGYGIVFRMDGSTGGFDIIGAIVKKYYSLHMGGVIFGFNCLIMLVAAFLFGVAPAMFTLISMFINATVTGRLIEDDYYKENIQRAKDAGLMVGVYFFSQALDELEAYAEASYTLKLLDGIQLDLPVYMDYEFAGGSAGRLTKAKLPKSQMTANAVKFCETIEESGLYEAGFYANRNFLNNTVDGALISSRWPVWVQQQRKKHRLPMTMPQIL